MLDDVREAYSTGMPPQLARGLLALDAEVAVSARGATVQTKSGRELVDLASGGFGFGHPRILEAVKEQVRKMPLSSRVFYSVPLARLLERIAQVTPGDLAVSFFGNAGAEAVEGALKLVKGYHRKRTRVVSAIGGYHGATTGALAVSGIEKLRYPMRDPARRPVQASWVPFGDVGAMERAVDESVAAVILEPVQLATEVAVPPAGYLRAVRRRCTDVGALLIADETITGLGPTGKMFGVDHDGVVPDIMVLAGVLGGGMLSIGGYVTTRAINDKVYDKRDPLLHANTTGGNPTACTAALTTLEIIEQEGLAGKAAILGQKLQRHLTSLAERYPGVVTRARGQGLFGSITLAGGTETARALQRAALARGVMVRVFAPDPSVNAGHVAVRAPLTVSESELQTGLAALDAALDAVLNEKAPMNGVGAGVQL
ncbi:aspartate aminotransferase family protein [Pendulispora albinea]|uniref:Aspartate aminotransferase family protein n=1 Tax=Pendulispora albinea TaxID=2741071 RepID=A0ABZ2MBR3_9BACT